MYWQLKTPSYLPQAHFLHCSSRLPLSPSSASYDILLRSSQGKSEHSPQYSKSLLSQQFLTSQTPQKGFSISAQPSHSFFSLAGHSLQTIPHLESAISHNLTKNPFESRDKTHLCAARLTKLPKGLQSRTLGHNRTRAHVRVRGRNTSERCPHRALPEPTKGTSPFGIPKVVLHKLGNFCKAVNYAGCAEHGTAKP